MSDTSPAKPDASTLESSRAAKAWPTGGAALEARYLYLSATHESNADTCCQALTNCEENLQLFRRVYGAEYTGPTQLREHLARHYHDANASGCAFTIKDRALRQEIGWCVSFAPEQPGGTSMCSFFLPRADRVQRGCESVWIILRQAFEQHRDEEVHLRVGSRDKLISGMTILGVLQRDMYVNQGDGILSDLYVAKRSKWPVVRATFAAWTIRWMLVGYLSPKALHAAIAMAFATATVYILSHRLGQSGRAATGLVSLVSPEDCGATPQPAIHEPRPWKTSYTDSPGPDHRA